MSQKMEGPDVLDISDPADMLFLYLELLDGEKSRMSKMD